MYFNVICTDVILKNKLV